MNNNRYLVCPDCDNNTKPIIECLRMKKGDVFNVYSTENEIICMENGSESVSFGKNVDKNIPEKTMFVYPAHHKNSVKALEDSKVLIFRIKKNMFFCEHFSLEMLFQMGSKMEKLDRDHFGIIEMKEPIVKFLYDLDDSISNGLTCPYFLDLKQKEFFYMLRAYYTVEELYCLLYPMINTDQLFTNSVFNYYTEIKTVKELADKLHYSLSGFEKRFKKVFGVPAYQWMQAQKSNNILHEIKCSKKTFSEISADYNFSSPSHFSAFCKSNFGKSPGKLRREDDPSTK